MNSGGVTERQHAFLEYANSLLAQDISAFLLADYLVLCDDIGFEWLSTIVARTPIRTERDAHQLIDLCSRYGLEAQRKRIHKVRPIPPYA
jgi:hypothetical protein